MAPRVPVVPPPPHEQPGAPAGIAIVALPWSHPGTPAGSQVAPGSVAGAVALTGAAGAMGGAAAAAAVGAPLGTMAAAAGPAALAMLAIMGVSAAWFGLMGSVAHDMAAQVGRDAGLAAVEEAAHESIGPVLEEHIVIAGHPSAGQWNQKEAYRGPMRADRYAYVVLDGAAAHEVPCVHERLLSCGCADFAAAAFLWQFATP